jgi:DNA-binding MarR family transcriptional regulator
VSRQVALLERTGMVAREPDPGDGRAQLLVVTGEGRKRLAHARGGRRRVVREQLDRWPDADVATFAELLGRFNTQMDAALGRGDTD